ncbi:MAG: MFS transporter [Deltaproteobacteria bacterium]|nr:MFS transporter [Deltaproteobacteria bacterium]MBW2018883.1 MFS transporter [Deltaproteobacteria bacterium]MBW2073638.1 MFS transporter [Deltaproteobacteria bacterium]
MDQKETRKTVRTFALASFLNDLGSDMIYPIWPLFVTAVLGANMAVLGFIDGLGEAIVSISQGASGYISDKTRKRKVFVWLGYLFGSLSRVGYALSTVWQHLILFRILDRTGKIRGAPRDAIIADISIKENRGKNFGLLRAMDHLGAVCGVVICILFFELLGYRNLFLLAAIPSAIGALLIYSLIKEKKPSDVRIFKGLSFKDIDKNFKLFLLSSSFFALGSFSYSFLLIYAKEFGFQAAFVPVLYLIFTAVASVFSLPFGKLSDKIGRKSVLMLSFIFWGLVCLSFIFIQSYLAIILTFVLYGLHKGALEPVQKTFVSELAPRKYRASSLGGFQMVVGLCALPASLIAGMLWEKMGKFTPFYFSLALTFLSIVMLIFVKEK